MWNQMTMDKIEEKNKKPNKKQKNINKKVRIKLNTKNKLPTSLYFDKDIRDKSKRRIKKFNGAQSPWPLWKPHRHASNAAMKGGV